MIRIQDKGSRFVVLSQQEYQNKMLGQLNTDLNYDSLDHVRLITSRCGTTIWVFQQLEEHLIPDL